MSIYLDFVDVRRAMFSDNRTVLGTDAGKGEEAGHIFSGTESPFQLQLQERLLNL